MRTEVLPGGIGERIVGLDLGYPLSGEIARMLSGAFDRAGLLVISGQSLSHDEQARVMGLFGPTIDPRLEPDSYITNREGPWGGLVDSGELCFHSDYAFFDEPPQVLSLHAVQVVDHGSTTRFASAAAALAGLPPQLRTLAESVSSRHVFPTSVQRRECGVEVAIERPECTRPLVLHDARSGQPYVYLSHMMIDGIPELTREDGEALIDAVYAQLNAPSNVYDHSWVKGDLVIWNNMTFQHCRGNVSAVGPRILQKAYTMSEPTMPRYPKAMRDAFHAAQREGRQGYDENGRSVGIGA